MDGEENRGRNRWAWLREDWPELAKRIAEERAKVGADWVAECWRRGVVDHEPGWFYASRPGLSIGTATVEQRNEPLLFTKITATQLVFFMRPKEVSDGTP